MRGAVPNDGITATTSSVRSTEVPQGSYSSAGERACDAQLTSNERDFVLITSLAACREVWSARLRCD
jgi:hypothetical protein